MYAQLSMVKTIKILDFNHDGLPDIILGGNEFNFQPQLGRLDASFGEILINGGKGRFKELVAAESELELKGEMRDIVPIKTKNGNSLLLLQNNESPILYSIKRLSVIHSK